LKFYPLTQNRTELVSDRQQSSTSSR